MKSLPPILFAFLMLFFSLLSMRTFDDGDARSFALLAGLAGAAAFVTFVVGHWRRLPRQTDDKAALLDRVQELEQRLDVNEEELAAAKAQLRRVSEETEFYKELHAGPRSG